jgi:hypothetical protein
MQKELNLKKHYHQEGRSGHQIDRHLYGQFAREKRPRRKWCYLLKAVRISAMGQREIMKSNASWYMSETETPV